MPPTRKTRKKTGQGSAPETEAAAEVELDTPQTEAAAEVNVATPQTTAADVEVNVDTPQTEAAAEVNVATPQTTAADVELNASACQPCKVSGIYVDYAVTCGCRTHSQLVSDDLALFGGHLSNGSFNEYNRGDGRWLRNPTNPKQVYACFQDIHCRGDSEIHGPAHWRFPQYEPWLEKHGMSKSQYDAFLAKMKCAPAPLNPCAAYLLQACILCTLGVSYCVFMKKTNDYVKNLRLYITQSLEECGIKIPATLLTLGNFPGQSSAGYGYLDMKWPANSYQMKGKYQPFCTYGNDYCKYDELTVHDFGAEWYDSKGMLCLFHRDDCTADYQVEDWSTSSGYRAGCTVWSKRSLRGLVLQFQLPANQQWPPKENAVQKTQCGPYCRADRHNVAGQHDLVRDCKWEPIDPETGLERIRPAQTVGQAAADVALTLLGGEEHDTTQDYDYGVKD